MQLLTATHACGQFSCGHTILDRWLQQRALSNQATGASRTYVIATARGVVIGYYSLAPTALDAPLATGPIRRNAPSPIPTFLLGRLAVDFSCAGKGVGLALINDALARVQVAGGIVGRKALLAHAIDEVAKNFYLKQGFTASPIDPLLVMTRV
ncbi:GNAT family N-acetyltransferase [Mitsuaria sp. 7]|uniref:GNAT family N-acetyltransferase n=1 Tax=Mitsuaria sp. 7 TaxID=1658665 RepID=UPI0009ECEA00|nr:GNAT family N-acetyltransferase [Mitsuaria sp. 7]